MMRLPDTALWKEGRERWRTSGAMRALSRWELRAARQYSVKEGEYEI